MVIRITHMLVPMYINGTAIFLHPKILSAKKTVCPHCEEHTVIRSVMVLSDTNSTIFPLIVCPVTCQSRFNATAIRVEALYDSLTFLSFKEK